MTWRASRQTGKMNGNDCGDTSGKKGSHRTDWRLPNIRELQSLVDYAFSTPAISNATGTAQGSSNDPFTNLQVAVLLLVVYYRRRPPGLEDAAWLVGLLRRLCGRQILRVTPEMCLPFVAPTTAG